MLKKISIPFLAFLQTTGLIVYITLISTFFSFIAPNLDNKYVDENFFAPIIMLTLFVMSALISATLILGRAGMLFWEKNYKDAFKIILWTVIWGFMYFTLFISYLLIGK